VPANPPDDRLALSPRLFNCTYHSAKGLPSQYLGQGIQPRANAGARPRDLCEVSNRNLAWPRGERISAHVIEFERLLLVNCHLSNKVGTGHDHGRPWFLASRRSFGARKTRGMRARRERAHARKSCGSTRSPPRALSRQEMASTLMLRRCRAALSLSR